MFNLQESKVDAGKGWSHLRQLRRASPYTDGESIVGFREDENRLMDELFRDDPCRRIISIFGMGGLGKTTLARKLYNNGMVQRKFDCHAMVSVSMEYDTRDLLQRIRTSFEMPSTSEEFKMLKEMGEEDLESHLRNLLQCQRYLAVIDDVWTREAWQSLKRAFPESMNGSRVIITTRNKDVAQRLDDPGRIYAYELPFLSEAESWELFSKKAFPVENPIPDRHMEAMGREMVRKCNGLPLAIVVLGSLLYGKDYEQWQVIKKNMWQLVHNDSVHVKEILTLSFNDLPCRLKQCFLYTAMFPEDYEIEVEDLMQLWVAEQFIPFSDTKTLEEVALEYLDELIDRSLVQVAERQWKRIVRCRVHDLLRDLAIDKAKNTKFLSIYSEERQDVKSLKNRRLASYLGYEEFTSSGYLNPCLRTLLCVGENHFQSVRKLFASLQQLPRKFQLLRTLDLGILESMEEDLYENFTSLPEELGKLMLLRYFKVTGKFKLPSTIGNLQALQTLHYVDDQGTEFELPDEICNMEQLRHLTGKFKWSDAMGNLTNLQTLDHVVLGQTAFTFDSIGRLRSLKRLQLMVECPISSMEPLFQCQQLLQLSLIGIIEKLPDSEKMRHGLPNLKFLHLGSGSMKEDPMPALEKLQNLTFLVLSGYVGESLVCTRGGFLGLEVLQLVYCKLKSMQVEEGGLQLLKYFDMECSNVDVIPDRIKNLPSSGYSFIPVVPCPWPY